MKQLLSKTGEVLKDIEIRHDLIYLFLFAFFLRSIYFALMLTQIGSAGLFEVAPDCINYVNIARGFPSILVQPDRMLYTFGPGYGFFLSVFFLIFGQSGIPVLITQIILSSLSCVMMYKVARMLSGSYAVSIIAGIIAALSYTSISLSNIMLSDTVYFFFFLLSLILYLRALEKNNATDFVLSGLLVGYCILTRSIGQLWIIAMIVIAVAAYLHKKATDKQLLITFRRYFKGPLISIVIATGIVLLWIVRNWIIVGVPITASAAVIGVGKLASITVERLENRPWGEVMGEWHKEFEETEGRPPTSFKDSYQAFKTGIMNVITSHPIEFGKTYLRFVWANIHDINYLPRSQFSHYKGRVMYIEAKFLRRYQMSNLSLILSLIGFIVLLFRRQYYVALILGLIFLYYGLLGGFGPWQGSRYFYPGQISWAILCSISLVTIVQFVIKSFKAILAKKQYHAI